VELSISYGIQYTTAGMIANISILPNVDGETD
jgi:hypothetical protein